MKKLFLIAVLGSLFALVLSCNNNLLDVPVVDDSTSRAISWSPWTLQLPDGSTKSGSSLSSLSNAYFYKNGSYQAFMVPKTGKTTSGSSHVRTELRETSTWKASKTNTLKATARVAKLGGGSSGKTAIGQVFISDLSIPLCELMYMGNGKFQILYEEAKGGGTYTTTSASASIGSSFTYELALTKGKLTVKVNGSTIYTKTPSSAVSGKNFYFKAGNYDQTSSSGSVSTTPYTVVEFSSISISHS